MGPVLGGVIAEALHWSVIFWINLPLGLAAYLDDEFNALKRLPRHERPHKLDMLGAFLMTSATMTLLLALSWGGTHYRVGLGADPRTRRPVGILLWIAVRLAAAEAADEPLIPLDDPGQSAWCADGTIAAGFGMGTFIGLTIYLPLYFETVVGAVRHLFGARPAAADLRHGDRRDRCRDRR